MIKETIDPESIIQTTDDFTEYITNNFVPKELRNKVEKELGDIIMDTFEEFVEVEVENPTEDEIIQNLNNREIEGELPMKELFNIDIQSIIDRIVKERLSEASVPLGPEERPVDDPNNQFQNQKMKNDFDNLSADDLNGPDPSRMRPEEVSLENAIEEYANQSGKQMHIQDFKDVILGILHEFDNTEKITQLKRFIGTVSNTTTNLREPQEYEEEIEMPTGEEIPQEALAAGAEGMPQETPENPSPELGGEGGGVEPQLNNDELQGKMQNKKNTLQRQ